VFDLVESKLHPPAARPGIVARSALVDRLVGAGAVPVIAVVAPAGYGKSTLLAQWAARKGPRLAWLACDDGDNDPAVLLSYLAAAVARVEPVDPGIFRTLAASGGGLTMVPRLLAAVASGRAPITVALDHVDALTNDESRDVLTELAVRLPVGWQLAMASRHPVPLRVGRLRVEGGLLEIGARDLAMDAAEGASLLEGAGLRLPEAGARELVARTEGWPTGLYLAALAMQAGAPRGNNGLTVTASAPSLGGYLRTEILGRATPEERSFLTRTSVLDRMCGSLCDATLGETGSARLLEMLESRNLLVVPLDRRREWYRYHHLFRQLLRSELGQREPDAVVRGLHGRAAAWFEANGMPEAAIEHAQAVGDADHVARLVLDRAQPVWASGRADTVLHWMAWFEHQGVLDRYPAIAVHGALMFALVGQPDESERWAAVARCASPEGTLADGSTMAGLLAYLRAILAADGVAGMRRDARSGWEGLSPISPYRPTMVHTEGLSYLLDGDLDRADAIFGTAFEDAVRAEALPLAALVLAERCVVAVDRHDWPAAEAYAGEALAMVEEGRFEGYWTSALVYTCAARAALRRGEVDRARGLVDRAARLRPLLVHVLPVVSVQALLELARAYLGLADPGGASAALRQVAEILERRPDLGVLVPQTEHLRTMLDEIRGGSAAASSLTSAELRLVPLLPTYLSLREIGQRLQVSHHTVKTQVGSIYRKLGVSSRREAVARVHELGMQE
jgi:LuxR family maltose regulon positive regulatory protein